MSFLSYNSQYVLRYFSEGIMSQNTKHKKKNTTMGKMNKVTVFYLSFLALLAQHCLAFLSQTHMSLNGRFPRKHGGPPTYRAASSAVPEVSSSSASDKASRWQPPFQRALDVCSIVTGDILAPLLLSLMKDGLDMDDWDAFWSRQTTSSGGYRYTNAKRVAAAIEQLGPTYVKFGQALSARPDVIPAPLANALTVLQDQMQAFDSSTAYDILRTEITQTGALKESELDAFIESLSTEPVAAASIGQVYKGFLPGYGPVAVKVQRPGIRDVVQQDATMLRSITGWIESLPGLPGGKQPKLVAAKLTNAVDEFMTRLFEELDYRNEVSNLKTFASLYSFRNGSSKASKVVVPQVLEDLCTKNVIVMEWIEGSKLTDVASGDDSVRAENLALVNLGIECTLLQLLDSGVMHADPHPANLIKTQTAQGYQLAYLDFGMLSTIPEQVRDGLVCAVAQLIFA
jgi:predicted unusual protein kinase regulating ubiquinone biosynthesis (AarF/ABC1/UbiB family)